MECPDRAGHRCKYTQCVVLITIDAKCRGRTLRRDAKRLLLWGEPSVRERNKNFVLQSDMPECGGGNDCVGSPHYKAIYRTENPVVREIYIYLRRAFAGKDIVRQ
jgi:hypothetical protein